jgi:hypothetical protein
MTYRYVLIIGGRQEGGPLASAPEVHAAVERYLAVHRDSPPEGRIMVGRLVQEGEEALHGRGVFPAESFAPGAHNPNLDELYWHGRIRDLLNGRLEHRAHFLLLHVRSGDGNSELDDEDLLGVVSEWISQLTERQDQAYATGNGWSWTGYEFRWRRGALDLEISAMPRSAGKGPLNEVVGNPEPAFAFFVEDE